MVRQCYCVFQGFSATKFAKSPCDPLFPGTGPEVIKLFMLNSTEYENSSAHKNYNTDK